MKFIIVFILLITSALAQRYRRGYNRTGNGGFVFSASISPKANQSKLTRLDTQTETSYQGVSYLGTVGYKFTKFSLLGNLVKTSSENKSISTQKREDLNYGATLRYHPTNIFYLQSTYWITNTELEFSNSPTQQYSGNKLTAGAGIRIPTMAGPDVTVSANYIIDSKLSARNGSGPDIFEEKGYSFNFGGTLRFSY